MSCVEEFFNKMTQESFNDNYLKLKKDDFYSTCDSLFNLLFGQ